MHLSELPHTSSESEAKPFLESIGINESIFQRAISSGIRLRNGVGKLHPVTAAGSRMWEEIIAEMRAALIEQEGNEWGYSHEQGLSLTHNRANGITLVVSSGDKNTGLLSEMVKTKNAKGPSTLEYVGKNLSLFEDPDVSNIESLETTDQNQTWVLLYNYDPNMNEVRYELSLPKGMHEADGKLKIDDWLKRIIFSPIKISTDFSHLSEPEFNDEVSFTNLAIE